MIAVLAAASACGKKNESKDQPTGAAPAPTTPAASSGSQGVTESELTLGMPAAFSGPSAGLGIEQWRGAQVAFLEANEAGGINGRKIRLVLADDGYEADKAAAAVVKLINDGVFAIFAGVGTPTIVKALPVVKQYYSKEGLFYFANFTGAQPQRNPPYFEVVFNVRASYQQETKAIVDEFVKSGRKKIGTFVQDDAYGTDGREGVKKALQAHGLDLAADTRYPRGQKWDVSNATQLKLLKDAGVDAIVMVGAYQACGGMVRDTRASGWNVPIHNVSFVGADQMLKLLLEEEKRTNKKLTTNLINTQVVPFYNDTNVPLVAQYRAAMDKYDTLSAPSGIGDGAYKPSQKYTFGSLEGYLDAKVFLAVLERTGAAVSRKSFYSTAESMGQFDVGLGVPAELSTTRHQALDKVWFTVASGASWMPTDTPMASLK